MHGPSQSGKVQTVLGPISPGDLGITLTHEHLLVDLTCLWVEPTTATEIAHARQPLTLENLNWVRYHWSHWDNLHLEDVDTAVSEALIYKKAGGNSIVDVTNIGISRDPQGLTRIAHATGLNIIMGAGYYVAQSHPPDMDNRTEDDIAEETVRDLTMGVGDTGVKAGVIGEVGCTWPLHPNEKKVLRAVAKAQRETGAPISIHPGYNESAPLDILGILARAGADLSHTIMGHIERTVYQRSVLKEIAQTGCFVQHDLFGKESYLAIHPQFDMPSDAQRLDQLSWLIAEGHLEQILLSHDICRKIHLRRYGGFGYSHILEVVVPWMRRKGFSEAHIQTMLVDNPRRALAFK